MMCFQEQRLCFSPVPHHHPTNHSGGGGHANHHHHHHHHQPGAGGGKRRPSGGEGGAPGPPALPGGGGGPAEGGGHQKKQVLIVAGPWDLELPTNVIMFERAQLVAAHPHPETEVLRFQYIMKLRQSFQEMCHSREGNGTAAAAFMTGFIFV